jgi:alkylhydroperoxidase family enzyme
MPRIQLTENGTSNFEKALNHVPLLKKLYDDLYELLWEEEELNKEAKEKIRLYLANVNGCATCMSLSYVNRSDWNELMMRAFQAGDFSAFTHFDQVLFAFIEKYRINPRSVEERDISSLKTYFSDAGIVKLMAIIHLFDGFHKMIVSLDLYDVCSNQRGEER